MTGAIHQLSAIDALASLNSGPDGLDDAEAARRLGEFGPNRVEHVRRALPSLRLLKEFGHFFAIVLWIAAGLSFVADRMDPGQGMARLVRGDLILVAQGDVVPADLVEAFHVRVNTATLTGESVPKARTADHRRVRHRHAHGLCRTNADGRSVPGSLWTSIAAWAAVPDGPCS